MDTLSTQSFNITRLIEHSGIQSKALNRLIGCSQENMSQPTLLTDDPVIMNGEENVDQLAANLGQTLIPPVAALLPGAIPVGTMHRPAAKVGYTERNGEPHGPRFMMTTVPPSVPLAEIITPLQEMLIIPSWHHLSAYHPATILLGGVVYR